MPLLTCSDLKIGYGSRVIADRISFTLEQGDYLCIVGENGCGKSTLLRTIAHLQPALGGSMSMNKETDGQVGYLSQQQTGRNDFPATCREIVLSGFLNKRGWLPFYTKSQKKEALRNMEKLDALPLSKKSFSRLSGGQQQRVLLARALCASGKMLLLDEPVTGLDAGTTAEMYRLIDKLNKEEKLTILMVSHDMKTALSAATHVL